MAETVVVEGVVSDYPIKYNVTIPEDADENFFTGVVATMRGWGIDPPKHVGHLVTAALEAGAKPVAGNNNGPPRTQSIGGGWACPVHGDSNTGPGFRGQGVECKQWADDQQDWTKTKAAHLSNGSVRWYCRYSDKD